MSSWFLPSVHGDIYSHSLGSWLRQHRVYDPDFALVQDPEIYLKIRRDAIVAAAIKLRKHLVAGRDWYLEPASDRPEDRKVAQIMEFLIRRMRRFDEARFHLAEAVIRGSSWAGIYGQVEELRVPGDNQRRRWYVVKAVKDASKLRFRQVRIDGEMPDGEPAWGWEIYRSVQGFWEPIRRWEWVHHVYDDAEEGLGHGMGLATSLLWYLTAKERTLQYGLQYLDRWANGVVSVGIDSLRKGAVSTAAGPNLDDRQAITRATLWRNEINKMRHGHVLVHDKLDELEVHDAPQGAWTATLQAVGYFDAGINIAVLGSNLSSMDESGTNALGQVHANTREAYIAYDHAILSETITDDIVRPAFEVNRPCFIEIGLGDAEAPFFRIRGHRMNNPVERAQVFDAMKNRLRIPIKRVEVYDQLEATMPSEDDDVVEPAAEPQAQGGGLPGGMDAAVSGAQAFLQLPTPPGAKPDAVEASARRGPPVRSAQDARAVARGLDRAAAEGTTEDVGAAIAAAAAGRTVATDSWKPATINRLREVLTMLEAAA